MNELEENRRKIGAVDKEIAALFEKRMEIVGDILDYKKGNGLPILDAAQEERVISNNISNVKDPAKQEYYVLFLREMMRISKAYQSRLMYGMKVAYAGTPEDPAGIASHAAFPEARGVAYPDYAAAYEACEKGDADVALLPLEDKSAGLAGEVTDLAFRGSLYVNLMLEADASGNRLPGSTRYAVFSRTLNKATLQETDGEHFILMFAVRDEAGSLAKILNVVGSHGFNMISLHSRPMAGPLWNHYFFAELEGFVSGENGQDLLRQLGPVCDRLRMLGSYKSIRI